MSKEKNRIFIFQIPINYKKDLCITILNPTFKKITHGVVKKEEYEQDDLIKIVAKGGDKNTQCYVNEYEVY